MFDYKKLLEKNDFDNKELGIWRTSADNIVEIGGNYKGLLYFACRIAQFVLEDCSENDRAEDDLDPGIDLTDDSASFKIFLY